MKNLLLTALCLQAGPLLAAGGPGAGGPALARPAQTTITGTVTDKLTGAPLEVVTVVNKLTQQSAITNAAGKFTISVDNPATDELVFSFVGYQTVEEKLNGRTTLAVALQPTSTELNEVVVNALGFIVAKDKIGYASSKVEGAQVANSGETGVID
ncbi:MAG: hypothetical protein EOO59_21160, partial [Hymenobacter sp.]